MWTKHHGSVRIKREDHKRDQGLLWESTAGFFLWGVSSVGRAPALQAGGRGFKSHTFHIWVGSESANAADCKSAPFGGSGLDTYPTHLAAVVQMEEASGLSPVQCGFESHLRYIGA